MKKEIPKKLRHKKEAYKSWNQGLGTWEEYGDIVWVCSDGVRKAKDHLELNLARDMKGSKKAFYGYFSSKR